MTKAKQDSKGRFVKGEQNGSPPKDDPTPKDSSKDNALMTQINALKATLEDTLPEDIPHEALIGLMPVLTASLVLKQEFFVAQSDAIRNEVSELREMLPEDDEEDDTPRERTARVPRMSNTENMEVYVVKALKQAGRKGLTKRELAQSIIDLGYQTKQKDLEKFSQSVYTGGIYKIMDRLEHFRDSGREGRYRLKK